MENKIGFRLELDEKEIVRLLGYKESLPDEALRTLLREEIENASKYIRPKINWKKLKITNIKEDSITLENKTIFQGKFISQKLKDCQYIVVAIYTIGERISEMEQDAFNSGDYVKGILLDSIGTEALYKISKMFWKCIVNQIKEGNIGITSAIFPGDNWDISEQSKIFNCFDGVDIGVTLKPSNVMFPIKSQSLVYGLGEGIGIAQIGHICKECSLKSCNYRKP